MTIDKDVLPELHGLDIGPFLLRRDFLKIVGGGIVIFFTVGDWSLLTAEAQRGRSYPTDPNAYLRIDGNGAVTVMSGKIEMGQGVVTSLAQMAAEELGVPLDSIHMIMGDTDLCPWDMGTFGSMSTRFFGPALRAAAAEAKAVLVELAAERLQLPQARLRAENGAVADVRDPGRKVTYGELARGQAIARRAEGKVELTPVGDFKIMGKDVLRRDAADKVTGKAIYAGDLRLPGMLYARMLRPPAHGATLRSVDTAKAENLAGVRVVKDDDLVAVLHQDPEKAAAALAAIQASWSPSGSTLDDANIFDHLVRAASAGEEADSRGDLKAGEEAAAFTLSQRYLDGYVAHAPMETHTALAAEQDGKMTVWASTQTPFPTQERIAQVLGVSKDKVRVITPFVGGGFGGKSAGRQAEEAARLSKITGKPVQVLWTREEEFYYDTFHPAAVVDVRSGVDRTGKICLWDYNVYAAGSRGTDQYYDVPNSRITVHGEWMGESTRLHPFAVGPWRAPGANTNTFAKESQIDLMAARLKADPLEFRFANLRDPRMIRVLRAAAGKFGWKPGAAPSGLGRGIACGIDAGTYVATIGEVEVDKATGAVRVKRLVCAQDMGVVVNPEGAILQMEGCLTMGLGYALTEGIRFKEGKILDTNFDTYELPRFSSLPELETLLVDNPGLSPQGGGEPAIVGVGAVVANGIFDATGARVFRLPMTPERVREALSRS